MFHFSTATCFIFRPPFTIAYNNLFDRRIAYLFDPETDDIFKIEMAPALNKYEKWEPFIPFRSLHYITPDNVEYIGKLQAIIADTALLQTDLDAWARKQELEINKLSDEARNNPNIEYWQLLYSPIQTKNINAHMPESLRNMFRNQKLGDKDILLVDGVVTNKKDYFKSETDCPLSITIIRQALLFKGKAAYILSDQGI